MSMWHRRRVAPAPAPARFLWPLPSHEAFTCKARSTSRHRMEEFNAEAAKLNIG